MVQHAALCCVHVSWHWALGCPELRCRLGRHELNSDARSLVLFCCEQCAGPQVAADTAAPADTPHGSPGHMHHTARTILGVFAQGPFLTAVSEPQLGREGKLRARAEAEPHQPKACTYFLEGSSSHAPAHGTAHVLSRESCCGATAADSSFQSIRTCMSSAPFQIRMDKAYGCGVERAAQKGTRKPRSCMHACIAATRPSASGHATRHSHTASCRQAGITLA